MNIRQLNQSDWVEFRDIRLHALETEPSVFGMSHTAALVFSPKDWRNLLMGPGAIFGVYDDLRLIGITAVLIESKHPIGTATFGMSYLYPAYRGRGLSRLMYEVRLTWILDQGIFDRVVVAHRLGNDASRQANRVY